VVTNTCALFAVRLDVVTAGARIVNSFLILRHLLPNVPASRKSAQAVLRFTAEGKG